MSLNIPSPTRTAGAAVLRRISFFLFALLPFHVLVMYLIANVFGFGMNDFLFILLKSWKEGIVLLAILLGILIFQEKRPLTGTDKLIMAMTILGISYTIYSERLLLGLWSFRALFTIFLFYALGRLQTFEITDFHAFSRMLFRIGILTAIFGVLQVEVLGPEFHFAVYGLDELPIGIVTAEYGRARATSTFISVHEFGLFMVFSLFAYPLLTSSALCRTSIKKVGYLIGSAVIVVGLFYSFSRSSILILAIGILILAFRKIRYLPFVLMFLAAAYVLLNFLEAFSNIELIAEGRDPSATGHYDIILDALERSISSPFGIGLGQVGVIARRFDPDAPQFEGEWFNVLVQMGFPGGILMLLIYFGIFLSAFTFYRRLAPSSSLRDLSVFIILLVIGMFLREMILPRDQMNSALGWFLIGAFVSLRQKVISGSAALVRLVPRYAPYAGLEIKDGS